MKITDVRAIQARAKGGNVHIVKIETDEGLYGIGESGLSHRASWLWRAR